MAHQLAATRKLCANVDPINRKQFFNPSMGVITITQKNGWVTTGAS